MRQLLSRMIMAVAPFCAMVGVAPVQAATNVVQVQATVAKPLTLAWIQDLDLGSVAIGPGTWSNATVSISRAGVFSCANANITCSGSSQVATYNVTGNNNDVVRINVPNVTLVNQSDPTKTLTLVVDSPTSITLTNSGKPGSNFSIGGSITLNSSTVGGTYAGTFNVTVNY